MLRKLHLLYFLFFANYTISQVSNPDFYREDQFYFSIYYNSIKNGVDELKENKFSSSLNFGFIRDFPLNKSGKFSLGLGAGLGINSLNNNLRLDENILSFNDNTQEIQKNKYNYTEIQFPLEIRWRNSSSSNYKFWRIYAGLKYSKVIQSAFKHDSSQENYKLTNLPINLDQLGLTLNIGYNTWNIGLYKSLRPFFNKNIQSLPQGLEQFKVGLIFYIL